MPKTQIQTVPAATMGLPVTELNEHANQIFDVLQQRAQLDIYQLASRARLSVPEAESALRDLERQHFVRHEEGKFGLVYELDRETLRQKTAAA